MRCKTTDRRARRRIPAGGYRDQVAGDRGACCGGEWTRRAAGAHAAGQVSNDIVDRHLLSLRLPGQAASLRSLLQRLIVGRTPRRENVLADAELRSFTVPLLFVWPEDDLFLAPAAGKPSVDKIPGARFVTMPGGHFPWYDDPDQCAALVAEGL